MDDFNRLIRRAMNGSTEPINEHDASAQELYKIYRSYIKAGFDEDQAFELTLTVLECCFMRGGVE